MWIVTTHDDKVAITSCTMKGYEIGCNKPGCRKEWKTERGKLFAGSIVEERRLFTFIR